MATFAPYTPPNTPERLGSTPISNLCPKFCILRGNGILTPLVALDELPYDVRLKGIPRIMDISMGRVRNMECLGEYPSSGKLHLLERPIGSTARHVNCRSVSNGWDVSDALAATPHIVTEQFQGHPKEQPTHIPARRDAGPSLAQTNYSQPPQLRSGQATLGINLRESIDEIGGPTPATSSSAAHTINGLCRPLPPSGAEPDQGKKEYCTYWIRTGECDYTQQGCLFKHEMPDRATLEIIGFRSLPKWWQENTAVRPAVATRNKTLGDNVLERYKQDNEETKKSSAFPPAQELKAVATKFALSATPGQQKTRSKTQSLEAPVVPTGLFQSTYATSPYRSLSSINSKIGRSSSAGSDLLVDIAPLTPQRISLIPGVPRSSPSESPSKTPSPASSTVSEIPRQDISALRFRDSSESLHEPLRHAENIKSWFRQGEFVPRGEKSTTPLSQIHTRRFVNRSPRQSAAQAIVERVNEEMLAGMEKLQAESDEGEAQSAKSQLAMKMVRRQKQLLLALNGNEYKRVVLAGSPIPKAKRTYNKIAAAAAVAHTAILPTSNGSSEGSVHAAVPAGKAKQDVRRARAKVRSGDDGAASGNRATRKKTSAGLAGAGGACATGTN